METSKNEKNDNMFQNSTSILWGQKTKILYEAQKMMYILMIKKFIVDNLIMNHQMIVLYM